MSEPWRILLAIPVIAGLFAAEQQIKKELYNLPSRERILSLGEANAKELLLLMEAGRNGKVSKQEFVAFMDAEFDRLEKFRPRAPEVKGLTQLPAAEGAKTAAR